MSAGIFAAAAVALLWAVTSLCYSSAGRSIGSGAVNHVRLWLALLLTALITVCMSVLGVTLIAAMLVIPPVIGRLLTDSFHRMLWISVAVGTFCGFVGVYLSYYLDWASGPAVVLTAASMFVLAYAFAAVRRRRVPEAALDAHVG